MLFFMMVDRFRGVISLSFRATCDELEYGLEVTIC